MKESYMSQDILSQLIQIIDDAAISGASDIHIKTDCIPYVRNAENKLYPVNREQLSKLPNDNDVEELLMELDDRTYKRLSDSADSADGSASIKVGGKTFRLRLNAYRDYHGLSLAIRVLNNQVPSMTALGLPVSIQELRTHTEGLILFYGATGSGKTTAMYSFIDSINHEDTKHIIMLDDPIEIILESDKSPISQREIGAHCPGFASGLKSALRENPNIISLGELRDAETISTALKAAETGHLVISSIHAASAEEVVDRVLQYFPAAEHLQRRRELANAFLAAVGCRLFERVQGGRIAAYETILRIPAIVSMLRSGDANHIQDYINANNGMQSIEQAISDLQFHHLIK